MRVHTLGGHHSLPTSSSPPDNGCEQHDVGGHPSNHSTAPHHGIHSSALRAPERRIPSTKCRRLPSSSSPSITLCAMHTRTPDANRIRRHVPQAYAVLRRVIALTARRIIDVLRNHDSTKRVVLGLHAAFNGRTGSIIHDKPSALRTTHSAPENARTNNSAIATCAGSVQLSSSSPSTRASATFFGHMLP